MRYTLPECPSVVTRTLDTTFLNTIANHPDVRPWLGGDGVLDLHGIVQNPANLALVSEHGGFIGVALGAGRYDVHSLFLPDGRRGETVRAMRAALDVIFTMTDCTELVTKVPHTNRAAAALAQLAGFETRYTLPMRLSSDTVLETAVLGITLERWATRSERAQCAGNWLHTVFADAKQAAQSTLPEHSADDDVHDRFAGAATLMVAAGNPLKAVTVYNQWATYAGYSPIHLLSLIPVVLDLDGMVIQAHGHSMEVLSCR